MKMKTIIAVAALACASIASAATNYVAIAAKSHNANQVVSAMMRDSELSEPDAFRAALEAVDHAMATGKVKVAYRFLSRKCPLTVRSTLEGCKAFSPKVREDMLALCGYDAANCGVDLRKGEPGYVNFRLQVACGGNVSVRDVRREVLDAAVVPARRYVWAQGDTFVGKDGAKRVKAILDGLAAELNAPRFGKANELLARIGIEVEWAFIQSRLLGDREVSEVRTKLLDGEIAFSGSLQNKLCVALGVEGYNAFVKEYNGDGGNRDQGTGNRRK